MNWPIFLIWMMCWLMGKAAWFSEKPISINCLIHCLLCHHLKYNKTEMKSHFAVDEFKRNKCKSLVQSKPGRQKEWMLNFVRSFLLNGKFTNLQYVHPLSFQVLFTKRKPLQHMYISLIIILKTNTLRMNFFSIAHPFWSIYIHILPQLRSY